jgi:hypothetical protein
MPEPDKKRRRKRGNDAGGEPTVLVAFRVPAALADRLEALAARLSTPWHEMSRSAAARAALERGIEMLDEEAAKQEKETGERTA